MVHDTPRASPTWGANLLMIFMTEGDLLAELQQNMRHPSTRNSSNVCATHLNSNPSPVFKAYRTLYCKMSVSSSMKSDGFVASAQRGFTQCLPSSKYRGRGHTTRSPPNPLYQNSTFIYILAYILSTLITKLVTGRHEALVEIETLAGACELNQSPPGSYKLCMIICSCKHDIHILAMDDGD